MAMPNDMLLGFCVRATLMKQQVQQRVIKSLAVMLASSPVAAFAEGDDVAAMINSAATGSETGTKGVLKIAQFIGVVFVIGGLIAAKNKKDNPQIKVSHVLGAIVFGALLVVVPEVIKRSQAQVGLTPVTVG
jgi:hypothetical protein